MNTVYLSLGSNLGDKQSNLTQALAQLQQHPAIRIESISSYYKTDPIGFTEQDVFINIAAALETTLSAFDLLTQCQKIEDGLKRKRTVPWGPRTLDIDILLFNHLVLNETDLQIPHPRLTERAFVLVPLQEIAPELTFKNKPIHEWVKKVSHQTVTKMGVCTRP